MVDSNNPSDSTKAESAADDLPGNTDQQNTLPPPGSDTTIPPQPISEPGASFRRTVRPDVIPDEFDDYQVLDEIARGGMGIVYRVHQKSLDRIVALKTVLAGRFASDDEIRLFRTEARAAGKLNHPGIVPVYDVGECHGFHYFSMPLIDGVSLGDRLTRGPIDPDEAARVIKSAAETIHFAHQHNVIHRDLKPGNILVDEHGQPLITDFGIAHRIDDNQTAEQVDSLMGTAEYMSPEQASGEPAGPLADVYSLGATLYCLLTGRPPFQSSNPLDTLLAVLESEPVPPRLLNERIPRDLELICLKCMQKRPEARYESAQEVADELGRFLAGEPVLVHPVGNIGTFIRWTRRQPRMAALATGLVVCFTAALVISIYYNFQLNMQREIAEQALRAADLNGESAELHRNIAETLLKELSSTQNNVSQALSYSSLGELCASATVLAGTSWEYEREQALSAFRVARESLDDNLETLLAPALDAIESAVTMAEADPEQLTKLVDDLIVASRTQWRSSTDASPQVQQQICSLVFLRANQLLQEILEEETRYAAERQIDSFLNLVRTELIVVSPDEIYAQTQEFVVALNQWASGPAPEELRVAATALTQSLDNSAGPVD